MRVKEITMRAIQDPQRSALSLIRRMLNTAVPLAVAFCFTVSAGPSAKARVFAARPSEAAIIISGVGGAGWAHCSAGGSVADPGGVRGLFVAGANQISRASTAAAVMRLLPSDPTICGANLIIPWSSIDNGPGASPQYDWSFVDQAAAPWEAAGKIVNLIVWGTDENASQAFNGTPATPAYVLSTTDTVTCPDGVIPVYWESGYQTPWRAFQAAVISHVSGDPNIGYIRFGLGTGGEDFPVDGFADSACFSAWTAKGMSASQWLNLSISQVDYEASLGSSHPINIGLNPYPGTPDLPDKVAAEAVKFGMGIGMQGMTVTQTEHAKSHSGCYANWCSLFNTYAGQVPIEMQTYSPTTPDGGGMTGALPPILDYVLNQAHVQVLELYPEEWLVADDPTWPSYGQYHAAYSQALAQAASVVGGTGGPSPAPPPAR